MVGPFCIDFNLSRSITYGRPIEGVEARGDVPGALVKLLIFRLELLYIFIKL